MSKTLTSEQAQEAPPQPQRPRLSFTPSPASAATPLGERTSLHSAHRPPARNLGEGTAGKGGGSSRGAAAPPTQPHHLPSYLRPGLAPAKPAADATLAASGLGFSSLGRRGVPMAGEPTGEDKENGHPSSSGWHDLSAVSRGASPNHPFSSSNGGRPFEATPPSQPLFDDGRPLLPPGTSSAGVGKTPAPACTPQGHGTWVQANAPRFHETLERAQATVAPFSSHANRTHAQQPRPEPLRPSYVPTSAPRGNPYTESLRRLEEYTARHQTPYSYLYSNLPQPPPPPPTATATTTPPDAERADHAGHGGHAPPYRRDEDLYRESVQRLDEMRYERDGVCVRLDGVRVRLDGVRAADHPTVDPPRSCARTRLTNSLWRKEMQLTQTLHADPSRDPLDSPLAQELTRARAGLPPSPPNEGGGAGAASKASLFSRTSRFEGASSARIPAQSRTPASSAKGHARPVGGT